MFSNKTQTCVITCKHCYYTSINIICIARYHSSCLLRNPGAAQAFLIEGHAGFSYITTVAHHVMKTFQLYVTNRDAFSLLYCIEVFNYLHAQSLENNDILLSKSSRTIATDTLFHFKLATNLAK